VYSGKWNRSNGIHLSKKEKKRARGKEEVGKGAVTAEVETGVAGEE
jgi:hypothetical protein